MIAFLAPWLIKLGFGELTGSSLKSISIKMLLGIAVGAFLTLALWGWNANRLKKQWEGTATTITAAVAKVAGMDPAKLKPKDAAAKIVSIGQDRDIAVHERDSIKTALDKQTASVRAYEAESNRLKAISDQNVKQVAVLVQQRDAWIAKAKVASTRTERQSCEDELKEIEGVLDALYANDF